MRVFPVQVEDVVQFMAVIEEQFILVVAGGNLQFSGAGALPTGANLTAGGSSVIVFSSGWTGPIGASQPSGAAGNVELPAAAASPSAIAGRAPLDTAASRPSAGDTLRAHDRVLAEASNGRPVHWIVNYAPSTKATVSARARITERRLLPLWGLRGLVS